MMTGCGSILWMPPEILLGEAYNEKVDVFAFAMTMVEVVDGHLPVRDAPLCLRACLLACCLTANANLGKRKSRLARRLLLLLGPC